jgi:pyrimidine-nucleoside phosphorylase
MNVPEFIRRKREGETLGSAEIEAFITGYVAGEVPDYQAAAFLMAVFFRGMTPDEAAGLTRAMLRSGETYDLSAVTPVPVDKHSTGGVGDKVSLILAPLAAAAGAVVPMVSGRGLGHTGGTLDKLDAIPGYRWDIGRERFVAQLRKVGCAIIGQTPAFVPADRKLYALRDVTATVESVPLICASILSKKAAAGTKGLVMDVKCGSGAFMDSQERARELATSLVRIGTALGMRVRALLTRMDRPLGTTIGNALEVREAVEILRGQGPADSTDLTVRETAEMLVMAGIDRDLASAEARCRQLLASGKALDKFREWIAAQGGDPRVADDLSLLKVAEDRVDYVAARDGILGPCDARLVGVAGNVLGAGRMKADDIVDTTVGFVVHRRPGDAVRRGEPILTIYHAGGRGLDECRALLDRAYPVGDAPVPEPPLVIEEIG